MATRVKTDADTDTPCTKPLILHTVLEKGHPVGGEKQTSKKQAPSGKAHKTVNRTNTSVIFDLRHQDLKVLGGRDVEFLTPCTFIVILFYLFIYFFLRDGLPVLFILIILYGSIFVHSIPASDDHVCIP